MIDARDGFWDRVSIGWHAVFLGLVGMTALLVMVSEGKLAWHRWVAVGTLTALAGWYWVLGRPRFADPEDGRVRWQGLLYLAGLYAACWVVIGISEIAYLMLFMAFPHTWAILHSTRNALLGSGVLVSGLVLVMAGSSGWTGSTLTTAVVVGLVQLTLSGLLGMWINGITMVSTRQAALIRELERTQEELAQVSHEAGVLAERERLAADIHDTLAQGFTSVLMLVQAAEADLDGNTDSVRHHLALAQQTARENLAEARSLVSVLAPPTLDGGLPAALGRLVDRFGQEMGVVSTVDVVGDPLVLPANREVVLLRATQEALANIRKHAGASTVAVSLTYGPDQASLRVRDDGGGFDPAAPSDGYGLAGMRSRLEQVGGSLAVSSAPAGGTTVLAVVPA